MVVTSISVYGDLVRNITGNAVEVHSLVSGAENPHTFDFTGSDARQLHEADLVVLNGLGLEGWARQVEGSVRENTGIFFVGDSMVKRNPGVSDENPHLWMNPRYGAQLVRSLTPALQQLLPDSADRFEEQSKQYISELDRTFRDISTKLENLTGTRVIAQTPGMDLFLEAFGIERVEVIVTSPGTDPSARKMTQLLDLLNTGDIRGIIYLPQFSKSIPQTLHQESGVSLIMMSPLIGTAPHTETYIDLLWFNADRIYNALTPAS